MTICIWNLSIRCKIESCYSVVSKSEFDISNIGFNIRQRTLINQLFIWSNDDEKSFVFHRQLNMDEPCWNNQNNVALLGRIPRLNDDDEQLEIISLKIDYRLHSNHQLILQKKHFVDQNFEYNST
jgi:hypothetical protein